MKVLWVAAVSAVGFATVGSMAWAGSSSDHGALVGVTIRSTFVPAPAFTSFVGEAMCLPGERATGGGYQTGTAFQVVSTLPRSAGPGDPEGETPVGWVVSAANNSGKDSAIRVFVVCAGPQTPTP
jgi:hypothetical protein